MINYARERAIKILQNIQTAVLATNGLSGVQVSEFPCEAVELNLYLLLPHTSDHLFNLEQDDRIALHTAQWELTGKGQVLSSRGNWPQISLVPKTGASWYILVKIVPVQIRVLSPEGWGFTETIDLTQL